MPNIARCIGFPLIFGVTGTRIFWTGLMSKRQCMPPYDHGTCKGTTFTGWKEGSQRVFFDIRSYNSSISVIKNSNYYSVVQNRTTVYIVFIMWYTMGTDFTLPLNTTKWRYLNFISPCSQGWYLVYKKPRRLQCMRVDRHVDTRTVVLVSLQNKNKKSVVL